MSPMSCLQCSGMHPVWELQTKRTSVPIASTLGSNVDLLVSASPVPTIGCSDEAAMN